MSTKTRPKAMHFLLSLALLLGLAAGSARAATLTFAVGATNAVTNSQVVVPIRVANFTGVSSFSFSFHWNTNVARFMGVEQFVLPGQTTNDFGLLTNDFGIFPEGTLTTLWVEPSGGGTNVSDGTQIFGIRFRLVGPAAATSPVRIDGNPTDFFAANEFEPVPVTTVSSILSIDRTLIVTCQSDKIVECGTPWQFDLPQHTDSCGGLPVTINVLSTVTNFTGTCGFTAIRTWEILDACSNRTVCAQTVTAIDTTPPVVSCAPNKTIEFGTAWNFDRPTGNDSCIGTNVSVAVVSTSTNFGPCGLTYTATRTWSVFDGCSNAVSCTQIVTVRDTTAPVITCAPDKNVNCLGLWNFNPPFATDIADGTNLTISIVSTVTNGTCGSSYTATRTWRATDSCGNFSQCSQTAFGRAIVTVSGTAFLPTNYPATLSDKRVTAATLVGPTNTTAATVADGTYSLVFDAANNVTVQPLAPTSGQPADGVSTLDITFLRRHILNLSPLDTPYKRLAGDVDGSSSITTLDLSFVRRLVLGSTNRFPRGLWRFVPADFVFANPAVPWSAPTNRTYASVGADTAGQDFVAIKLGDVNNSWTPPASVAGTPKSAAKKAPVSVGGTNGVTFIAPVTNGFPGDEIVVPIITSGFTFVNGFQFTLRWNTQTVAFVNLGTLSLPGMGSGNFNTNFARGHTNLAGNPGIVTVQWDEPSGGALDLPEGALIFEARFRLVGAPSNSTPLTIDGSLTAFEVVNGNLEVTNSSSIDGSVFIKQPNRAPNLATIAAQSISEGVLFNLTPVVTDADGSVQTQTFSLDAAPAGAGIDSVSGQFTWTPTEAQGPGVYPVTIRVTDNGTPAPLNDTETFNITVNEINSAPVLTTIGNLSANEGGLLSFTATATDSDLPANNLTYTLEGAVPSGASITTAGAFTWTPSEVQGPSTNTFTVRVTDNGTPTLNDFEVITIVVSEANGAPTLAAISSKTVNEGSPLAFTAVGNDLDTPTQVLTYSLSNAPSGASINSASGVFSWTPTESQGPSNYVVTVIVTDNGTPALSDSKAVSITVNEVNVAPTLGAIGNRVMNELTTLSFAALGGDVDLPANTLTYSLSNAPAGASINPGSGIFNWTPTEAQGSNTYTFTIRVTDNGTPVSSASETITVQVNETIGAPVLAFIGNKFVNEGSLLTFTNSATDEDVPAQILTYSLSNAPAGASLNASNGVFTWTPTEAQGSNTYFVTVIVTDSGVPAQVASQTVIITVGEVTTPPVLAVIGAQGVSEGSTLNFTATATDADLPAQTFSYSLSNAPAGATIHPTSGVFSWTPAEVQGPNTYQVTVIVTDSGTPASTAFQVVTITVSEVTTAPVLAAIGNKTVNEGALLNFNASATDNDLPVQTLTYSLDAGAPSGASITSGGVFTWTPTEAQGPGSYNVTVRVTDSGVPPLSVFETITISVNESNIAPSLAAISNKTVVKNTPLSFSAVGSDLDSPVQTLTYSLDAGAPAGASIDPATGAFTWTPSNSQGPSTNSLTIRVTDNGPGSLSSTRTFSIVVFNDNTPPELAAIGNKEVTTQTLLTFPATANDAESTSQTLTFTLENAPAGATINPLTGVFTWTPTDEQGPGTNLVTVRVTDSAPFNPLNDSETIQIIVHEFIAPTIAIADVATPAGSDGSFTAEFEITLSAPVARTVTVQYETADGSALGGEDYTPLSGTLVFEPGITNLTLDIEVAGKSTVYTNRTFFVQLSQATNGALADAEALGTLLATAAPGFYIDDVTQVEGNAGRSTAVFTVLLRGPHTLPVTVNYVALKGSALARKDFTVKRGKLKFPVGTNTVRVSIPIVGETLSEFDENYTVILSRSINAVIIRGTGHGTILDDDALPAISISDAATTEANTGVRALAFTLRLSAKSGRPVSVDFSTMDGTAVSGSDYLGTNGTAIIPAGKLLTKISVPVVGNARSESNETFFVNLANPVNATLGDAQGAASVKDTDRGPAVLVGDALVFEGASGKYAEFTVLLSAPSEKPVSVNLGTSADTAVKDVDYVARPSIDLYFPPGETAQNVRIALTGNPGSSGRRFNLIAVSAVNAALSDKIGTCVIP